MEITTLLLSAAGLALMFIFDIRPTSHQGLWLADHGVQLVLICLLTWSVAVILWPLLKRLGSHKPGRKEPDIFVRRDNARWDGVIR